MADDKLAMREEGGLMAQDDILSPVMNLAVAKRRLAEFQEFVKDYLKEGEDFGIIPGTPKPTLLKPGADKLCELYGLADSYRILDKVEDYDAKPPLFDYTIECTLTRLRTGLVVATGLGSCNSYESHYRWRKGARKCPECGKETIIKGKQEYGGGWLCFAKKGGCGAKYKDGDKAIEGQSADRVENEDIIDQKNTVLKMGKKRAKIDATLSATRSSGVFTQDLEDIAKFDRGQETPDDQDQREEQPAQQTRQQPAKGKARPAAKVEDVMCSQCQGVNGHTKDCPTVTKKAEAAAPAVRRLRVAVMDVKKMETNTKPPRKYIVIEGIHGNDEPIQIYSFHATPMKYADGWKGQLCELEITEKAKKDGSTFWHFESILRAGKVSYMDNAPTPYQGTDAPTAGDLGFEQ